MESHSVESIALKLFMFCTTSPEKGSPSFKEFCQALREKNARMVLIGDAGKRCAKQLRVIDTIKLSLKEQQGKAVNASDLQQAFYFLWRTAINLVIDPMREELKSFALYQAPYVYYISNLYEPRILLVKLGYQGLKDSMVLQLAQAGNLEAKRQELAKWAAEFLIAEQLLGVLDDVSKETGCPLMEALEVWLSWPGTADTVKIEVRKRQEKQRKERQEAERKKAAREEAAREEAARKEAELKEAQHKEAMRQEAAHKDAAHQEAGRWEAERQLRMQQRTELLESEQWRREHRERDHWETDQWDSKQEVWKHQVNENQGRMDGRRRQMLLNQSATGRAQVLTEYGGREYNSQHYLVSQPYSDGGAGVKDPYAEDDDDRDLYNEDMPTNGQILAGPPAPSSALPQPHMPTHDPFPPPASGHTPVDTVTMQQTVSSCSASYLSHISGTQPVPSGYSGSQMPHSLGTQPSMIGQYYTDPASTGYAHEQAAEIQQQAGDVKMSLGAGSSFGAVSGAEKHSQQLVHQSLGNGQPYVPPRDLQPSTGDQPSSLPSFPSTTKPNEHITNTVPAPNRADQPLTTNMHSNFGHADARQSQQSDPHGHKEHVSRATTSTDQPLVIAQGVNVPQVNANQILPAATFPQREGRAGSAGLACQFGMQHQVGASQANPLATVRALEQNPIIHSPATAAFQQGPDVLTSSHHRHGEGKNETHAPISTPSLGEEPPDGALEAAGHLHATDPAIRPMHNNTEQPLNEQEQAPDVQGKPNDAVSSVYAGEKLHVEPDTTSSVTSSLKSRESGLVASYDLVLDAEEAKQVTPGSYHGNNLNTSAERSEDKPTESGEHTVRKSEQGAPSALDCLPGESLPSIDATAADKLAKSTKEELLKEGGESPKINTRGSRAKVFTMSAEQHVKCALCESGLAAVGCSSCGLLLDEVCFNSALKNKCSAGGEHQFAALDHNIRYASGGLSKLGKEVQVSGVQDLGKDDQASTSQKWQGGHGDSLQANESSMQKPAEIMKGGAIPHDQYTGPGAVVCATCLFSNWPNLNKCKMCGEFLPQLV